MVRAHTVKSNLKFLVSVMVKVRQLCSLESTSILLKRGNIKANKRTLMMVIDMKKLEEKKVRITSLRYQLY